MPDSALNRRTYNIGNIFRSLELIGELVLIDDGYGSKSFKPILAMEKEVCDDEELDIKPAPIRLQPTVFLSNKTRDTELICDVCDKYGVLPGVEGKSTRIRVAPGGRDADFIKYDLPEVDIGTPIRIACRAKDQPMFYSRYIDTTQSSSDDDKYVMYHNGIEIKFVGYKSYKRDIDEVSRDSMVSVWTTMISDIFDKNSPIVSLGRIDVGKSVCRYININNFSDQDVNLEFIVIEPIGGGSSIKVPIVSGSGIKYFFTKEYVLVVTDSSGNAMSSMVLSAPSSKCSSATYMVIDEEGKVEETQTIDVEDSEEYAGYSSIE